MSVAEGISDYFGTVRQSQNFSIIFLHLWKFAVISNVRTNSAQCPESLTPGASTTRETRWLRVIRPKEEAIEIGNR